MIGEEIAGRAPAAAARASIVVHKVVPTRAENLRLVMAEPQVADVRLKTALPAKP